MGPYTPDRLDIFEIYRRYSDIKSRNMFYCNKDAYLINDDTEMVKHSRDALGELHRLVDKSMIARDSVIDELINLMSQLKLKDDFTEFSNFYDFVFFMCREHGQKNITVSRAIVAWKLVLSGRFRLLNQWCDFVEKKQRHNISEDTWCQVLAFSRCLHEDLEGYDPEGAWPVLIDEFVEHMYRITGSSCRMSHQLVCSCSDPEGQLFTYEDTLRGLKGFPGSKRKIRDDNQRKDTDISGSLSLESLSLALNSKKRKQGHELVTCEENLLRNPEKCMETLQINSPMHCSMSPCAVERCLSKGFEGLLSSHTCAQFDQEHNLFVKQIQSQFTESDGV